MFRRKSNPLEPGASVRQRLDQLRNNPHLHDLRSTLKIQAQALRDQALDRADRHLESLIEQRHGHALSPEVQAVLGERQERRQQQAYQRGARAFVLRQASNAQEKQVLQRILDTTGWAGGTKPPLRYTQVLDLLAPSGSAEDEMRIHRALWSLAERHILAISPHGVISACPPTALALPSEV